MNIFGNKKLINDNENLKRKIASLYIEIEGLKEEIQSLKVTNEKLSKNNHTSILSRNKITDYVDELLKNPDINISMVPDFIEHPAYVNLIHLLLLSLSTGLEASSVEIFGHKIRLLLEPKD